MWNCGFFSEKKSTCKNPQFSPPKAAEKNPHVEKNPENFERKSSIHARWVKNDEKNCCEMKEYEKNRLRRARSQF